MLRNEIGDNKYIFNDYMDESAFNPKLKVRDQMATFLICESIEMYVEKEFTDVFSDIYEEVDKSLFHNMILNIDSCCFLYFDGAHPMYHAYFNYERDLFKNECIMPNETGYSQEHILLFLNYFYMLISSISIMDLEITNYLGATRPKRAILEK